MIPGLAAIHADDEATAPYRPALALVATGDTARGLTLLAEACDRRPADPVGANLLGAAHYAEGRVAEAARQFARAASLAKDASAYAYNEGVALLQDSRPREALAALWRSLHADALLPEAHYWAWAALERCGVHRDALACMRRALDQDPAQAHAPLSPSRLDLARLTLCAVDCAVPDLAARALRRSMAQCRFGAVKLFTSHARRYEEFETVPIPHVASIEDYSRFVMKSLGEYIDTDFALVTQWDGYVVNAQAWSNDFLDFDYIGARWADEQIRAMGLPHNHNVGNGGFSLRSDIYMRAGGDPRFGQTHPEDRHLCATYRPLLEQGYGIRFADAAAADRFSFEIILPTAIPFGFHGFFNICRFEADPKWMRFWFLDPQTFAG